MKLSNRIQLLVTLGEHLCNQDDELLLAHLKRTEFHNGWLTVDNYQRAIQSIAEAWLTEEALRAWVGNYPALGEETDPRKSKEIGLILAGNIPMVGFHDLISVFVSGHRAQVKLSDKDPFVIPYLLQLLGKLGEAAGFAEKWIDNYFRDVPKLVDFEAVIATGSNNSARYFEAYFGKYPNIIRRNRNAVAVLSGNEGPEELAALGDDIFTYFGLGCRNVAKLYVPRGYDFQELLEAFHEWRQLQNHAKYKNNFDYHYALLIVNREEFLSNGAVLLRENEALLSHIAGLYYSFYDDLADLQIELHQRTEEIQLIAAQPGLLSLETKNFGEAQQPGLMDYADGVDTMQWLVEL